MGSVYKGIDQEVQEEVAVKILRTDAGIEPVAVERFKNELKLAHQISHPHVCRTYHFGQESGTYYIVMEYVHGDNLKKVLERTGPFDPARAVALARQVCSGLAEAHRHGIIHRDLKPQNIMVDEAGEAKVMDFGIARSVASHGFTEAGTIVGTPDYMSPEQAEGKPPDRRSDIYSLGAVLFEVVTGETLFSGDTSISILLKHCKEMPRPPSRVNPAVPEGLNRIILKCLEKDPARRYATAEDLAGDLETLERTRSGAAPGVSLAPSGRTGGGLRRRPRLLLPLAGMTLAVLALLAWPPLRRFLGGGGSKVKPTIAVIAFENRTGEKTYNYLAEAIPNLLITGLEQSGRIQVTTWERMADLSRQLGKPEGAVVDAETGFDLCRLDRIGALAVGSYTKAGEVFATEVKVLDVATKQVLKTASARGEGVSSILKRQIDKLTGEVARGVMPSRRTALAGSPKVSDVTTTSMEAYNLFLRGRDAFDRSLFVEAKQSLEQAVSLDPTFAIAYLYLSKVLYNLEDSKGFVETLEKARVYSARASEKDRLLIEATYAGLVERKPLKRIEILEALVAKYPREKYIQEHLGQCYRWESMNEEALVHLKAALALDPAFTRALTLLGYTYLTLGDSAKALETFEKQAAISPGEPDVVDSIAETYLVMGDLDKAAAGYAKALSLRADFYDAYWRLAYVYMLREDYDQAEAQVDRFFRATSFVGQRAQAAFWKAFLDFWRGRYGEAQSHLRELGKFAGEVGNEDWMAMDAWLSGWIHIEKGDFDLARESFRTWFAIFSKRFPEYPARHSVELGLYLAVVDIRQDRLAAAEARLSELEPLLPKVDNIDRPRIMAAFQTASAELRLAQKRPDEAAAKLRDRKPVQLPSLGWGSIFLALYNTPLGYDVLARIRARQGAGDQAIAEYQRLLRIDPKDPERRLIAPRYHLALATLFERAGRRSEAQAERARFNVLWKSAPAPPDGGLAGR